MKKLDGCTCCGYVIHATFDCQFKFRNSCSNCGYYHWSYLCPKSKTPNTKPSDEKSKTTQVSKDDSKPKPPVPTNKGKEQPTKGQTKDQKVDSKLSIVYVHRNCNDSETILPTFTCKINGKIVRALKDSGAQSNFITTQLANELELPVVKPNLEILLNRINGQKHYQTKTVKVALKFGTETCDVETICIPHISVNLELAYLGSQKW